MLFGYRNRIRRVSARLSASGRPCWSSVACCTSSSSSPTTPGGSCRTEMDYTWFQLGLLAVLLVLIVNLIRNMRSMGGDD